MAFWRHFRPFGGFLVGFSGNMVGKWKNEPCSEVDEVVNHFWVLTIAISDAHDNTDTFAPEIYDV